MNYFYNMVEHKFKKKNRKMLSVILVCIKLSFFKENGGMCASPRPFQWPKLFHQMMEPIIIIMPYKMLIMMSL